jgi:DNA-directed RNA polymerase subunit RPC12/RpoP
VIMASTPPRDELEVERVRARAARRLLPFAVATAAGGGAIGFAAGGSFTGALAAAAPGAVFVLFARASAVARCPACGRRIALREKGPGSAGGAPSPVEVGPSGTCPRCRRPLR